MFAGAKTRAEREAAQRATGAIGPSLERIGTAEARAGLPNRRGGAACGGCDRHPRLSTTARAATGAVATAKDAPARSEVWRIVQGDKQAACELRAFGAAVECRFGGTGCAPRCA